MKNKENSPSIGYSFWGMIATIVGTVIGIGIFFKSPQIIGSTESTIMAIVAWMVGALVVGFMLMAYIEIASSTAKTGEVGSLSTWTHKFINPRIAKVVGIFLTIIYFPGIVVLLAIISTTFILEAVKIGKGTPLEPYALGVWGDFFFIVFIAIAIMAFTFALSYFLRKGGERFQIFGTILKFIPFFVLIVVGFFMGITGTIDDVKPISDPEKNPGFTENSGWEIANGFFLAMPAILFSFDGFLTTANLQNEMKEEEKKKFPKIIIISIILVATVYILTTIMSTWLGDYGDDGSGMNIPVVLNKMFGGEEWVTIIVLLIITISGMTTVNGFMMSSFHAFKSLSEAEIIPDPEGKLLVKNKRGFPVNSAWMMAGAFVAWIAIFGIAELVNYAVLGERQEVFSVATGEMKLEGYGWTTISGQISDANIIIVNVIYGVIILYALQNRKTNKVDVDHLKNFKVYATTGSVGVLLFSAYNLTNIYVQVFKGEIIQITIFVVLIIEISAVGLLYYINERSLKKMKVNNGHAVNEFKTKEIIKLIDQKPLTEKDVTKKPITPKEPPVKKDVTKLLDKKAANKKPPDKPKPNLKSKMVVKK